MTVKNILPAAVRRAYPLTVEATVRETFTPGQGWTAAEGDEPMTVEVADRLKRQGVTAVALTLTCTDGIVTFERRPDFQVAEVCTQPKPKAPSREALAEMTVDELFGAHKAHLRNRRVWDALIAAVLADESPERPGRLIAWDNGHSKSLGRLTKTPRGAMRYQNWIRSRRTFSKTTYRRGGALPG